MLQNLIDMQREGKRKEQVRKDAAAQQKATKCKGAAVIDLHLQALHAGTSQLDWHLDATLWPYVYSVNWKKCITQEGICCLAAHPGIGDGDNGSQDEKGKDLDDAASTSSPHAKRVLPEV